MIETLSRDDGDIMLRSSASPFVVGLALLVFGSPARAADESVRVARVLEVAPVWSGHPVGFDLVTRGDRQYVAFYDAQRRMTIAGRTLAADRWQLQRLPSTLGWDSHNAVVLAIDDEGRLHVVGNMHASPLVYFQTTKPWDIATFESVHRMVGREERRCTYPQFFRGPGGLVFTYRDGGSGNGNQIFNVYDPKARSWRRLLDGPLTDGEGARNAYLQGPTLGPDGVYHLIWVWRETPDCATNHDLSYARSRDLVHWETSSGQPLTLPIRLKTGEIVDPVSEHGGLINGCEHLGWDSLRRPVVTYHKFDANGFTQAYAARLEGSRWVSRQLTDWDYRWDFQGGGSIASEIHLGAVRPAGPGRLQLDFRHVKHGSGRLVLDEASLRRLEIAPPDTTRWPRELNPPRSSWPGMQVHLLPRTVAGRLHVLRWETLGPNRDRPRECPLPGPSTLQLFEIERD
jgi:BNR repeat-containing family member